MIKLVKSKNGKIYLFGDFNSSGVDKIVKFRNNNQKNKKMAGLDFLLFLLIQLKSIFLKKNSNVRSKNFIYRIILAILIPDPIRSISRLLSGYGSNFMSKFDF